MAALTNLIGVVIPACFALALAMTPAHAQDTATIERLAHGTYVAAINSNDAAYMAGYRTKWDKTSIGFRIDGDWASERYAYRSADTDRKTGKVSTDTGRGINIFHHDADGKWRVAIDSWSSDKPSP